MLSTHSIRRQLTALAAAAVVTAGITTGIATAIAGAVQDRDAVATTAKKPITVLFLRHAETDNPKSGERKLTAAGQDRADALFHLLRKTAITHLFTSEHLRTKMTLAPIAKATGLTPVAISSRRAKKQADALLALPPGSIAVVASHSNTLPPLMKRLGAPIASLDRRGFLAHDSHDRIFVVTLSSSDKVETKCLELRFGAARAEQKR